MTDKTSRPDEEGFQRHLKNVRKIVDEIKPILAGHHPVTQGAALNALLALWVAGHRPDLREKVIALHMRHLRLRLGDLEDTSPP